MATARLHCGDRNAHERTGFETMADAEPDGRLRLGMVGGGQGAFIGEAHRIAARLDDRYVLVAGALSNDPQVAFASGAALGLAAERIYTDYKAMAQAEATRRTASTWSAS